MPFTLITGDNDDGRRLDRLLRKARPDLPLSLIHRLLRQGRVLVDGKPGTAALKVRPRSAVTLPDQEEPPLKHNNTAARGGGKPPVPEILWEGKDLLAVNKPKGIAVHGPAALNRGIENYLAGKLPPSASFRPGPLHRLDQPTSGIIMFSISIRGARFFSSLLREHRVVKRYLALVEGTIMEPCLWEEPLVRDRERRVTVRDAGGKYALTCVKPLITTNTPKWRDHTLAFLEIRTGRTHQIRSQAAFHGHPLAGDQKYGGGPLDGGFLLHAFSLEFPLFDPEEFELCPETVENLAGKIIQAPVPEAFSAQLRKIFGDSLLKSCHNLADTGIINK